MISSINAELIFSSIVHVISYYFAININGIIQSFVANKLGDDTAIRYGYNAFNPALYLNFLNTAFLLLFGLPVPVLVPVNLFNLSYSHRYLSLLLLYYAPCVINIILAILALTLTMLVYNPSEVYMILSDLMQFRFISLSKVASHLHNTGFSIVILFLLLHFIYYNIFLAWYSAIAGSVKYIFTLITNSKETYAHKYLFRYFDYIFIATQIMFAVLFGNKLIAIISTIVSLCANYIIIFINFIKTLFNI